MRAAETIVGHVENDGGLLPRRARDPAREIVGDVALAADEDRCGERGVDLRAPLRRGAPVGELTDLISSTWRERADRGAEERLSLGDRRAFVPVQDLLRKDPHLEMHTRGG